RLVHARPERRHRALLWRQISKRFRVGLQLAALGPARHAWTGAIASQAAGEPLPCAQEFLRVDRLAFEPRFVVQVRSRRAPGRTDLADDLSGLDGLAEANVDRRQVTVAARQSGAAIDVDPPAAA